MTRQFLAATRYWSKLSAVFAEAKRTRGYVDYYHYRRLAAGQIDAVIESDINIPDIAALYVIVTEAGGIFTDIQGNAVAMDTRSVLAATPGLHPLLLQKLNPRPESA